MKMLDEVDIWLAPAAGSTCPKLTTANTFNTKSTRQFTFFTCRGRSRHQWAIGAILLVHRKRFVLYAEGEKWIRNAGARNEPLKMRAKALNGHMHVAFWISYLKLTAIQLIVSANSPPIHFKLTNNVRNVKSVAVNIAHSLPLCVCVCVLTTRQWVNGSACAQHLCICIRCVLCCFCAFACGSEKYLHGHRAAILANRTSVVYTSRHDTVTHTVPVRFFGSSIFTQRADRCFRLCSRAITNRLINLFTRSSTRVIQTRLTI